MQKKIKDFGGAAIASSNPSGGMAVLFLVSVVR